MLQAPQTRGQEATVVTHEQSQSIDSSPTNQDLLAEYHRHLTSIFATYIGRPILQSGFGKKGTHDQILEILYDGPPLKSENLEALKKGLDRAIKNPMRVQDVSNASLSSLVIYLPIDAEGNLLRYIENPPPNALAHFDLFGGEPTPPSSE